MESHQHQNYFLNLIPHTHKINKNWIKKDTVETQPHDLETGCVFAPESMQKCLSLHCLPPGLKAGEAWTNKKTGQTALFCRGDAYVLEIPKGKENIHLPFFHKIARFRSAMNMMLHKRVPLTPLLPVWPGWLHYSGRARPCTQVTTAGLAAWV